MQLIQTMKESTDVLRGKRTSLAHSIKKFKNLLYLLEERNLKIFYHEIEISQKLFIFS